MCGTFCMPSLVDPGGTEISKGGNFDQDALSYVRASPPASSGDITVISQILHLSAIGRESENKKFLHTYQNS